MTDEAGGPANPEDRKAAATKARAPRTKKTAARPAPIAAPRPAARAPDEIDPDEIALSPEDLARIEAKAKAQVAAERKKALETKALTDAIERIRGKAGMLTGNPEEDRLVYLTIDCPNSDAIKINGMGRFHGQTVKVPVHVARSIMEVMWRNQVHEHEITAKPRLQMKKRRIAVSPTNAGNVQARVAQGMADLRVPEPRYADPEPAGAA